MSNPTPTTNGKRRGRPPKNRQTMVISASVGMTSETSGTTETTGKKGRNPVKSTPLVINYDDNNDYTPTPVPMLYSGLTLSLIVELRIGKSQIEQHEKTKHTTFEEGMFMNDLQSNDQLTQLSGYDGNEHHEMDIYDTDKRTLKKNQIRVDDSEHARVADKYLHNQYNMLKKQLHVKNVSNTEVVPLKWKKVKLPKEMIVYNNHTFKLQVPTNNENNSQSKQNQSIIRTLNYDDSLQSDVKIRFMNTHSNKNVSNNDQLMTVADLPDRTDIVCWNDHVPFDGIPVVIPLKYENGVYYVFGNFCSFGCALRYIYDRYRYSTTYEELQSLLFMYYIETHGIEKFHDIVMAPELVTLCSHGGIYTLKQYREYASNNVICNAHSPNVVAINYQIEEIYTNTRMNSKFIPVNVDDIRESTLKMNEKYNTENSIGIELNHVDVEIVNNKIQSTQLKSSQNCQQMCEIDDMFSEQMSSDLMIDSLGEL
jgi:hypothetical protein